MTKQQRAAALWKYGNRYPNIWPHGKQWASDLYRQDRIERGVHDDAADICGQHAERHAEKEKP